MAQNLKLRYGEKLQFWDYRVDYYRKAMSEVELGEKRLRMLNRIGDPELTAIAAEMRRSRRAAYQEAMLEWAYEVI